MNANGSLARIDRFIGHYAFLSNFYPHTVTIGGLTFPTNEHAYNAAKTIIPEAAMWVMAAPTPAEARRRGRQVPLRDDWDTYWRYTTMETLIRLKFAAGFELARCLAGTGNAILVEGNTWHDNIWGVCYCERPECDNSGNNLLGWMLMEQRANVGMFGLGKS